jgi:nucleoside-diphosphate-sugar epimerase
MKKVLITGASGYVGALLVRDFLAREDVGSVLAIDKEPISPLYSESDRLTFIQANLADTDAWVSRAVAYEPHVVIHTAWQIREMYGKQDVQWKWNIGGSDAVFDFAFSQQSVEKLIHFSTVASYGAYSTNTIEHRFTEEQQFRESDYLYAEEKRIAEEHLQKKYERAQERDVHVPRVAIVRPAAITGPRGRYARIRFGLQAALSGQLKENVVHRIVSGLVSFVPVTKKWLRQFIHEDDVVAIITVLSFTELKTPYEAFNICPPGDPVLGPDMAKAVNKKMIRVHPYLIRIVFFFAWHLSQGRIPTSRGGWKSYSYPIAVDGSKITRMYGYQYMYASKDAFVKKEGRYMKDLEEQTKNSQA